MAGFALSMWKFSSAAMKKYPTTKMISDKIPAHVVVKSIAAASPSAPKAIAKNKPRSPNNLIYSPCKIKICVFYLNEPKI